MDNIGLHNSIDEIVKELDDKNLIYMTSGKIKQIKNNVLQKLYLTREELLSYHKKLEDYIYIDEIQEITIGAYIRWFDLQEKNRDNIQLQKGAFISDFNKGIDDINIVCKSVTNRYFSIPMNKCIIFKKLSMHEKILIKIIDHINK